MQPFDKPLRKLANHIDKAQSLFKSDYKLETIKPQC